MINTDIQHLAIIMDGNRRWAKERFMPAIFGHKAGYDNVHKITQLSKERGIAYLTLWALSTENLKNRGEEEIKGIIKLIHRIPKLIPEFMEKGVKFQTICDIEKLPKKTQEILQDAIHKTSQNSSIVLTVALIYGGQDEIVRATKSILRAGIDPDTLTQESFRSFLDTSILPPADCIIRTGGDVRHSGFLLYDSAYAEYYFTDKKWPEFDEQELDRALRSFSQSKRNFGK